MDIQKIINSKFYLDRFTNRLIMERFSRMLILIMTIGIYILKLKLKKIIFIFIKVKI